MDTPEVPLNVLAKIYLKIRAAEQSLQQEYDSKLEALKEQKSQISNAMKDQLMALKAKSVKTESGLVILGTSTRYYPSDWEAFNKFVIKHEAVDLLEKRVHQGNMKQYIEDNPDDVPPGLNVNTEYTISVRKA